MKPEPALDRSRIEWLAVAIVTLIGGVIRLLPIGRLGLTHFDEGIYALVASWSLQPKGLASLDPMLIPYAPPGYPVLGGLAYAILGRSDGSMIAVSQVAGTLTIPAVAWLARRTFGPGSGFAAAAFCAFSGSHIAYSRMALTDATFLLAWLLALGAGMRFLERPGPWRAVVMGLAVGLAQEVKYNGWLTGGIVVASAMLGVVVQPENRKAGSILKTFGWGGLAAGVAWLVVWPWYRFVEAHGGYSALLRHQQSYLGGWRAWWPNFLTQAEQAFALSNLPLIYASLGLAILQISIGSRPWVERTTGFSRLNRNVQPILLGIVPVLFLNSPFWLGLMMAPWLITSTRHPIRLSGVWWLVLSLMTPFYHPYARLWLPYHAVNWLFMGWLVANGWTKFVAWLLSMKASTRKPSWPRIHILPGYVARVFLLCLGPALFLASLERHPHLQPDLLDSSDSLYGASMQVAAVLPDEVKGLRLLVRPPVTYYLAGRVALFPMPGSDELLKPGDSRIWALADSAILRSEAGKPSDGTGRNLLDRFANNWEIVEEFPTTLSLPTSLDLDPGAARTDSADRSCPLWLLRPRRPRSPR